MEQIRKSWDKLKQFGRDNWHYLMVILFGLILTLDVWSAVTYFRIGDDANFHNVRLQSVARGLADGQIVPQVDPGALNGFGYAYNIFYGPLVGYVVAVLRILGTWQVAINLTLVLMMAVSGILMCYAMMKISGKKGLAALIAIIYMAAPYHMADLYTRVAVGELMVLMVVPLLILGLYQLVNSEAGAVRNLVIAATVMLLSHNVSTMLFALMAAGYLLLNYRKLNSWQIWRKVGVAVALILGLTAFFTLPLVEAKMMGSYAIFDQLYVSNLMGANADHLNSWRMSFSELLIGKHNSFLTQANIGIGLVAILGMVGYFMVKKRIANKKEQKLVQTMFVLAVVAFVLTTILVDWWWLPSILYSMQFPWRFMGIFMAGASIVTGYVLYDLIQVMAPTREKTMVLLAGILVICPVFNLFTNSPERQIWSEGNISSDVFNGSAGWQIEYAPIQMLCEGEERTKENCRGEFVYEYVAEPKNMEVKVLTKGAKAEIKLRNGTKMTLSVQGEGEVQMVLPLIWYPGYKVKVEGIEALVQMNKEKGLVEIVLENVKGAAEVKVWYGMSMMTMVGTGISIVTLGGIAGYEIARWKKSRGVVKTRN